MWKKALLIIALFYFLALLQNSFFVYFGMSGYIPNLVFSLFFLLVFFARDPMNYWIIFLSITAGFFLDIYSYTYLGPSIILLLVIGFLLKKMQSFLISRENNYPFVYFIPLFIVSLLIYDLFLGLCLHFLDPIEIAVTFSATEALFSLIYNALTASVLFYIYKKCQDLYRYAKS